MDTVNSHSLILLGQNIRKTRKEIGLSQEALAQESGLDRSYIGGIERGERNISISSLCKIAAALKKDVSFLTEGITIGHSD